MHMWGSNPHPYEYGEIMKKEIFNKELIEKYRDENGWISAIYKPEEFFNDSEKKRKEEK